MLIKLLTEARKGRENSSAKRDSLFQPEDGYLQLVKDKSLKIWATYIYNNDNNNNDSISSSKSSYYHYYY